MYRSLNDFFQDWAQEEALTLKVLETLTDASLPQAVSDGKRTLGDLGWHLVSSVSGMLGAGGLQVEGPGFDSPTPTDASEIVEGYRRVSEKAVAALKQHWNDEKLSEKLMLFGFIDTTYGGLLNLIVRHQIHHRGQMTVLIRQAGLVPPGVYGPNEEESAAMRQ
ncbi:damage-inducible protein DinB [Paenibacillus antri]|uniref:Damage-inducible protein DinB n=1 Tax=Paenibacillus antri TaxID=2582848 RepID=A0A5R9G9J0_9BACL|nr:DinB family protein [Paenibacillus antri]TLS50048.1 damage-inducible protein DinB [Paenibacillus antri]